MRDVAKGADRARRWRVIARFWRGRLRWRGRVRSTAVTITTLIGPRLSDPRKPQAVWAVAVVGRKAAKNTEPTSIDVTTHRLDTHDGIASSRAEAMARAGVECFERAYADLESRERLFVWIADDGARRELMRRRTEFPRARVLDSATSWTRSTNSATREKMHDALVAAIATIRKRPLTRVHRRGPTLAIGTDASIGYTPKGAGIAWISAERTHGEKFIRGVSNIFVAELLAIRAAIIANPDRKLVILSDSLAAVNALTCEYYPFSRPAAPLVYEVRESITKAVRIKWVKGHANDPLNLAADRLAIATRRAAQSQVSVAVAHDIVERIVATVPQAATGALDAHGI